MPEREGDRPGEADATDAVDAYWDALSDGEHGGAAPPGLDPELGAAVRLLHGVPAARPDAAFVARLEEDLLMNAHAIPGVGTPAALTIGSTAGAAPNGRWTVPTPVPGPARRRLWGRAVETLAAAALLLAILGGLVAGWGLRPERAGRAPTGSPGIARATPPAEGDGTAMYLGNAARTGEVPGPGPAAEPERRWSVQIAEGDSGAFWGAPIVVDGTAYVTGSILESAETVEEPGRVIAFDHVLAVDAATGQERWRAAASRSPDEYVSPPAVAGGLVYVGTTVYDVGDIPEPAAAGEEPATPDPSFVEEHREPVLNGGSLVAFDARTGAERWRAATGGSGSSSPAVADGVVYVGSEDGHLDAFDAATGAPLWRSPVTVARAPGEQSARVGALAVADGSVYASGGGFVHALGAATGEERWRRDLGSQWVTEPVVSGGAVYVGAITYPNEDGTGDERRRLHALDAATGGDRWSRDVPDLYKSPVVGDGTVYILTEGQDDGTVVALDPASGTERWSVGVGMFGPGAPQFVDGTLYLTGYSPGLFKTGFSFLGAGTSLFALDAASGEERWRIGVGDQNVVAAAVGAGVIYTVDGGGGDRDAGRLIAYGD